MGASRENEYYADVVQQLARLPAETDWFEFKENNVSVQTLGRNISALANAAVLSNREVAYIVWGVQDGSHDIVGTRFSPDKAKKGNELLEPWLRRQLTPDTDINFHAAEIDGKPVIVLRIGAAKDVPVSFEGKRYIRIGSTTRRLKDFAKKEAALWRAFDKTEFAKETAMEHVDSNDVLQMLDYASFFDLSERHLPDGHTSILEAMHDQELLETCDAGGWNITNLGGLLFARNLNDFQYLRRKALRVIKYRGTGRLETEFEHVETMGYAAGFSRLINLVMAYIPTNEVIEKALRVSAPMFPEDAVRELIANSLIHQDFRVTGTGPMVEIFDDRIEFTNPGEALVSTDRFVDSAPKSRNENVASLMRQLRICEERGSGIDKVVRAIEKSQLPPPLFEKPPGFTRSVVYAYRKFSDMDKQERIRACYQHACLRYVLNQSMTNASLRSRFGISAKGSAQASRLIRDSLDAGVIVMRDPDAGFRSRAYLPFWAAR